MFYESDQALGQYLLLHYGSRSEILPWSFGPGAALDYPARCVERFSRRFPSRGAGRALDLGCAVGRSSFELARHYPQVVGIDSSERFVACARRLQEEGRLGYRYPESGEAEREATALVPPGIDRSRVRFEQGDALFLREGLGRFDLVLMANLVDRLADPARCLGQMASRIAPGGLLVISSPYTWMEEHTPRRNWLGGDPEKALSAILAPGFVLRERDDLPFLIREHSRKYQWSVAEATLWERTA